MKRLMLAILSTVLIYSCSTSVAERERVAEREGRWQLLGQQEVGRTRDRDRIDVPRKGGPFRQLRMEVRGAPIEIREVVVTFGDGEKFRPRIPERLAEGRDYVIDLPGRRQSVDGVEFVYRSIDPRQQPAKVLLYAR